MSASITELIDESLTLERAGDIGAAFSRASEALDLAQALSAADALAAAQVRVAALHFRLGHYDQAQRMAGQALTHAVTETYAQVDAWLVKGCCAAETDDLDAAADCFLRAIDLSRQTGYPRALMRGLHNLATGIYLPRGQFELALAADQEVARLAQDHAVPKLYWGALVTLAWIEWLTGQHAQAATTVAELRRSALPNSLEEGYGYWLSANLALEAGALDEVLALYARGRSIAEAIGEPGLGVLVRLGASRYYRTVGDAAAARQWADDALTMATRVGYRHLQGMALVERARGTWALNDPAAAEADLRSALEVMQPLQTDLDLAHAVLVLAALLHAAHHPEAAEMWLKATGRIINGGYTFLLEHERALAFPLIADTLNSADAQTQAASLALLGHLERVPPPPLRIVALGRFEVWQPRRQVERRALGQRRGGELFRLLLVSPRRTLLRDQVIEALYPDKPGSASQAVFHQATSALRRALEPDLPDKFPSRYLQVEEGQVTLCLPPDSTVDFETFEQLAQAAQWESAIELYHGELFPADRYAAWAVAPRERLTQWYIRALLEAAQARLHDRRAQESLDACRRVLALEPWQEQAALLGMRACLALNRRAEAVRLYRNLERALRDDLNIAPQPELEQLYRSLG